MPYLLCPAVIMDATMPCFLCLASVLLSPYPHLACIGLPPEHASLCLLGLSALPCSSREPGRTRWPPSSSSSSGCALYTTASLPTRPTAGTPLVCCWPGHSRSWDDNSRECQLAEAHASWNLVALETRKLQLPGPLVRSPPCSLCSVWLCLCMAERQRSSGKQKHSW